jgi:hypothetical protein
MNQLNTSNRQYKHTLLCFNDNTIFYFMTIRSAVENQSDYILHFCKFICVVDCTFVKRRTDDGHRNYLNMLVKIIIRE